MFMDNKLVEVVRLYKMVGVKSSLQIYHDQWSVEDAVRGILSTSRERGTSMSGHPMRRMRSRSETSCCTAQTRPSRSLSTRWH